MPSKVSKKFLFLLSALIVIGFFIIFFLFFQGKIIKEEFFLANGTFSEPASQIRSPDSGFWQNKDFLIDVLDEDLEFGLHNNFCQYKIISYDTEGKEHSTGWLGRKCNSFDLIGVGEGKNCIFQGENACWVYVRSQDKAGNWHFPGEEKGSIKYYHIDWIGPEVWQISIEEKEVVINVRDNFKVAGCSLYLGDENLGPMSFLIPGCQKECQASKTLNFDFKPGTHEIFAVCRDAAGNYGWESKEVVIKENIHPEINFCRVIPNQGKLNSEFQFETEAFDPDGDDLIYLWHFGDGQTSNEKNPVHQYSKTGTFIPRIEVSDGQGDRTSCSTAWVAVSE